VRKPEAGRPLAAKMGREMVASLPPLRIWKSEAEGNPAGTGAIETGEADASLLLRAAVDAFEFRLGPGLEVSRSYFDRSNFLFLGSILPPTQVIFAATQLGWP
jgi:hypothetical protein